MFLARLYGSSPDHVTTIEDETLVGGVYSATWTMTGTFNGMVPYEAKGISIIKFRPWSREVYYWRVYYPWSTQAYYSRDYYSESDIMATIPPLFPAVEQFRIFYKCVVDPAFICPLPPL
jgi:hypothetical protein